MPSTAHESIMFKDLLGSDKMREIFSDNSTISAYLEVERALAVVQARLGLIPQGAADAIVEHAHLTNIDLVRYENRLHSRPRRERFATEKATNAFVR